MGVAARKERNMVDARRELDTREQDQLVPFCSLLALDVPASHIVCSSFPVIRRKSKPPRNSARPKSCTLSCYYLLPRRAGTINS